MINAMYVRVHIFSQTLFTIDDSADSVPPWRDLIHFKDYVNENFMDGSKWEDVSRVISELVS
jgi:hypothetical protein